MQALTLTAVRKDDKADLSLRSVYNYGNYGFTAIFNTSDKVNVTATIDKVRRAVLRGPLHPAEHEQQHQLAGGWKGSAVVSVAPVAR